LGHSLIPSFVFLASQDDNWQIFSFLFAKGKKTAMSKAHPTHIHEWSSSEEEEPAPTHPTHMHEWATSEEDEPAPAASMVLSDEKVPKHRKVLVNQMPPSFQRKVHQARRELERQRVAAFEGKQRKKAEAKVIRDKAREAKQAAEQKAKDERKADRAAKKAERDAQKAAAKKKKEEDMLKKKQEREEKKEEERREKEEKKAERERKKMNVAATRKQKASCKKRKSRPSSHGGGRKKKLREAPSADASSGSDSDGGSVHSCLDNDIPMPREDDGLNPCSEKSSDSEDSAIAAPPGRRHRPSYKKQLSTDSSDTSVF
jgi:hypothetical protein